MCRGFDSGLLIESLMISTRIIFSASLTWSSLLFSLDVLLFEQQVIYIIERYWLLLIAIAAYLLLLLLLLGSEIGEINVFTIIQKYLSKDAAFPMFVGKSLSLWMSGDVLLWLSSFLAVFLSEWLVFNFFWMAWVCMFGFSFAGSFVTLICSADDRVAQLVKKAVKDADLSKIGEALSKLQVCSYFLWYQWHHSTWNRALGCVGEF